MDSIKMKKIELIVPKSLEEEVIDILRNIETGFSLIDEVRGMGKSGLRDGIGLTDAFQNVLFVIIVTHEKLEFTVGKLSPIYNKYGGLLATSDIEVWKEKS